MAPTDIGRVAQSAERAPEKREVAGSTPAPATVKALFSGAFTILGPNACSPFFAPIVPHPCHNELASIGRSKRYRALNSARSGSQPPAASALNVASRVSWNSSSLSRRSAHARLS